MPKSTKDSEIKEKKSELTTKKTSSKKTTTKKSDTTKKDSKAVSKSKKEATTKSKTKAKTVNKKTTTKKETSTKKKAEKNLVIAKTEYYDLPYRYNQTVLKLLAQTPTSLFIYWDISDSDKENFKEQYGDNFFETTKPILIVHNDTIGYSFEVEINDFANSWYLQVHDSKCDYRIELGRKPYEHTEKIENDYVYISSSNKIESPNDKILFNKDQKMVYFKNTKTNTTYNKEVSTLSFMRNMGKIYNIYDVYKVLYRDEAENIYKLNNPSS